MFVVPILTAIRLQFPSPSNPTGLLQFLLQALHDHYAVVVGVASAVGLLGKGAQELLRAEQRARLKAVLDSLHETCFKDAPQDERYEHRATLFRANRRQTKLLPYCRSGNKYQRGIQPLGIDESREEANVGIAGQAWFRNATLAAPELPACPVPCTDNDPRCQDYARQGYMPVGRVRKVRVRSRSLLATPVRAYNGREWGVLVLDSRKPDAFTPEQTGLVESFATALGKMV